MCVSVAQSCPSLWDPRSPLGSPVHEIPQARILEWVAIPFSRGSTQPKDWTQVSCIAGSLCISEHQGKPRYSIIRFKVKYKYVHSSKVEFYDLIVVLNSFMSYQNFWKSGVIKRIAEDHWRRLWLNQSIVSLILFWFVKYLEISLSYNCFYCLHGMLLCLAVS